MNIIDVIQRAQEICGMCGSRQENLLLCPCRLVYYCSTACQLQHWKGHQSQCTRGVRGGARPPLKNCYYCGRASYHIRGCQCGLAFYCDSQCQAKHWGQHRRHCSTWDVPENSGVVPPQDRIMRIRRLDAQVQTDPLMFETVSAGRSSGDFAVRLANDPVDCSEESDDDGAGIMPSVFRSTATLRPKSATQEEARRSTLEPGAATPEENGEVRLLGDGGDGLYAVTAPSSLGSEQNPASHAASSMDCPDVNIQNSSSRAVVPTSQPTTFEYSGLLPTGGGDLSIRTSDGRNSASGKRASGDEEHLRSTRGTSTSRALVENKATQRFRQGQPPSSDDCALSTVNPLNIDAVREANKKVKKRSPSWGSGVDVDDGSELSALPSSSVFYGAHQSNHATSPAHQLSRKGTVMSSVLSGAAAHLSRSRSVHSGVFTQNPSFVFGASRVLDHATAQQQREWALTFEEFELDEEEERLHIACGSREFWTGLTALQKRLLFLDAAKNISVEEERVRVDVVTQCNMWLRTTALPAWRRLPK